MLYGSPCNARILLVDNQRERASDILASLQAMNVPNVSHVSARGLSMFVTELVDAERIFNRLSVVVAQFERTQALRSRLVASEGKLSETKLLARAKALLIKHDNFTEDEAHRALHQFSMQENLRLVDVAAKVIDAHCNAQPKTIE